MKRVDLIRHLERNGCQFLREGGEHSVYVIAPPEDHHQYHAIVRFMNSSHARFAMILSSLDPAIPFPRSQAGES